MKKLLLTKIQLFSLLSVFYLLTPQMGYTQMDTCSQFTGKVINHICERELVIQADNLPNIFTGFIKPTYADGIQLPVEGEFVQFDFTQKEVGTHFSCGNANEHVLGVIECLTVTGFDCFYRYGGFVTVHYPSSDSSAIVFELEDGRYVRPVGSSRVDFSMMKTGDRVRMAYENVYNPISRSACEEDALAEISINCLEVLPTTGCGNFIGTVVEDACGNRFYQTEGLQVASGLINPGRWEVLPNVGATIQFFFKEQQEAWIYCEDSSSVTAFGYIDCFEVIEDGNPPDQCVVTIANRECRTIGVYDENDKLLTTLPPAPPIISAFYQVTLPVWDDPQPLSINTTRKYIFKQNDLIVGSQTVSCEQPFINVANEYGPDFGDGCGDGVGVAVITNTGCRVLDIFGTEGRLIETVAPNEKIELPASAFYPIYVLVAGQDTLAIGPEFDFSYFDTGGCTDASPCSLLFQNNGSSTVEVFDQADNLLTTLWSRRRFEQLVPADTTLTFIFKEEGRIIGCQTVSCDQPYIIIDDFCLLEECEKLIPIVGTTFWDRNGNGQKEASEQVLPNMPIQIEPSALTTYSDEEGNFRFFVKNDLHTITANFDSCWVLSTDSLSYTISVEEDATPPKMEFGLQLISDYQHTQARITSAPTRCGFTVPFQVSVENDGCLPSKGRFGFVLSPLATLISAEIGRVEKRGDTLFWEYEELIANEITTFPFTFEIAGTDFIGEQIQMTGLSYIEDDFGNLSLSSTYPFTSEIRCGYDPNDKLVHPNRLQEYADNYTLFEENLEYTIRFQNTGNDTAFNVVIRDNLDKNLEWTTFKPILASHPYRTTVSKDGAVEFSFDNILLPDSTTNEPLSHGFVTYTIAPKKELSENTLIENTASIYFDFNPPIVTNTTQNVMVSELPKLIISTQDFSLEEAIHVYPNPFGEVITIEQKRTCTDCATFTLFDATGHPLQTMILTDVFQTISIPTIANGLYFYQIKRKDGSLMGGGKLLKH